ncbi:hypothetical protein TAMYLO_410023 [Tenacibaculum amylolyticum]
MPKPKLDDLLQESNSKMSTQITKDIDFNISLNRQEISDRIQDREERKKYAYRTFIFLSIFTAFILFIVTAAGFSEVINFNLEGTVLISLITSSFASVVGIFILVMRYLFR